MAIPKVSKMPFFLALVFAALVASSCHASRDAPAGDKTTRVIVPLDDPKCEVMERCNPQSCRDYCRNIGLGRHEGFCTYHDLNFYCCCPVPDTLAN